MCYIYDNYSEFMNKNKSLFIKATELEYLVFEHSQIIF